jgi:hypothetical protein
MLGNEYCTIKCSCTAITGCHFDDPNVQTEACSRDLCMVGLLKDAHHLSQDGGSKIVTSETGRRQESSTQQARRQ